MDAGTLNLLKVRFLATPADVREGSEAWERYHMLLRRFARSRGVRFDRVVGVYAALSPNNDYLGNLRDTRTVIDGVCLNGQDASQLRVSTYHSNKRKSVAIAQGTPALHVLLGKKTRSFYLNTLDLTNPDPITVDGHIHNAWCGSRMPLTDVAHRMTPRRYDEIAHGVRDAAFVYGDFPPHFQAIVWYTWRRMHRIEDHPQHRLWAHDAEMLGLEVPWHEALTA